jgi:hypothetical protein
MTARECPQCHAQTALAGRTPYCFRCGWQRKQAETQLRMSLKMSPIAFALLLGFILLMFYRGGLQSQGRGVMALFFAIPVIAFLVSYRVTRRNLNRLLALPPPSPSLDATAEASPDATAGIGSQGMSPEYQALLDVPPPRRVRMARRATMNLLMPMGIVVIFEAIIVGHLFFTWNRAHSFGIFETRDWAAMVLGVLLLFIPLSAWRAQSRERDLLENGEIALAKVVKQWSVRNGASIVYEFTDSRGEQRRQGGFDYTGKLFEGARVPVFYDRENSKRQVAVCSALHEVVSGSGRS